MIEPKNGEWWIGKWSGTNFNCVMQYNGKNKDWHDTGVESSPTEHSFKPLYKMEKAKPEPQKTYRYEKVTESIFDLKDEFEKGELYASFAGHDGADTQEAISRESELIEELRHENVYRKVDPVEELAREFQQIMITEWHLTELSTDAVKLSEKLARHAIEIGVK